MIIPSSISEIDCANQQYDFTSLQKEKKINKDRLADFRIKINGPDFKDGNQLYDQKYDRLVYKGDSEQNIMPVGQKIQYRQKITGYHLHRDSFTQEELFKTFNIIDVNKDQLITEDDLIFVLDYMKEQYTELQIKEMIEMVSANKKSVNFEQFKKIGKGEMIPLAKYRMPDRNMRQKQKILQNIIESQLITEDPQYLLKCIKKQQVSYTRYGEQKKNRKNTNDYEGYVQINQNQGKLFMVVPIRGIQQFKERKQLVMDIVLSNIYDLIYNYQQYRDRVISVQKMANMLQISAKQVKQLYPNTSEISSLLGIMEAIVYSREKISKKLELCLDVVNSDDVISTRQLIYIIQVIKGKDLSIENKIKAIMQSKMMKMEEKMKKSQAYQIVLEFFNKIMM